MKVVNCEQNSPEWLSARTGNVTASRLCDVLAKRRDMTESAARRSYKWEKVIELLTGRSAQHYVSDDMLWGIENEGLARTEYELRYGLETDLVGLVLHPFHPTLRASASPDALVGNDGLLEIKCPRSHTHLEYIVTGEIPSEYQAQMLWQMACTERKWCDFVSFDPRLPEDLQLWVKRLPRDDKLIRAYEVEVEQFQKEVDDLLKSIRSRNAEAVTA